MGVYGLLSFMAPLAVQSSRALGTPNDQLSQADKQASASLLLSQGVANGPGLPAKVRPTTLADFVPFGANFFTPRSVSVNHAGYREPDAPSVRGWRPQMTVQEVLEVGYPFSQTPQSMRTLEGRLAEVAMNTQPLQMNPQWTRMVQQRGNAIPAYQFLGDPREYLSE